MEVSPNTTWTSTLALIGLRFPKPYGHFLKTYSFTILRNPKINEEILKMQLLSRLINQRVISCIFL